MNYFSKATSFKVYDEDVKELPTFTICHDPILKILEFGKDFFINYGKSNISLMEGINNVQFNDFNEVVTLEKLITYQYGTCYMVSTNKEHQQYSTEGGYEIFYLYYNDNMLNEDIPTAKIFIASKENSYGVSNSYWVEGKVMKFDMDKNTNQVGVQLELKKEKYLIEKGLCNHESYQKCLGSELAKQDHSSCPKKCVAYSLPNKDLPLCETKEEADCTLPIIFPLFREIMTERICKKSCTTLDIFGEINVNSKNNSQDYHVKTLFYTFAPPYLVKVSEEYIIYDIIGMVASIGGTLGLFIGFSFTNVTSCLIDLMKKLLKNKRQCEDKEAVHFTKDLLVQFRETQKELKIVQWQIKEMQEKNGTFPKILNNLKL